MCIRDRGDSLLGDELEDAGAEEAPPAVDNAPEDAALPEEAGGREAPPVEETGALPQAARKNASVRQNAKAVIFFIVVLLCRPAGTARFQCKCCGRDVYKRQDLHDGRGDAYCGMLNCSYNLGLRGKTAYIPEYPVGTAPELAEKVAEFVPIARAILGLRGLKLITFGPRPDDFLACNGPIKALYDLGVAVEENSELDLLVAYNTHADDPRIPAKMAEMQAELGGNNKYRCV